MSLESDYLEAFEEHSIEGIRRALASGASATLPIKGKAPLEILVEGYLRSSAFSDCLRILISAGAEIDPLLAALLLDDDVTLQRLLATSPQLVERELQVP